MSRPNVLFVFTDEQRWDTLGCYGNDRIETPNLDRLAGRSTAFEQAYVTQPVCTPSRSSLMTGLYPHTNGCVENNIPLPADVPCIPEMLDGGQYVTAYMGKWHLGDEIFRQHGFDEWVAIDDAYRGHYSQGRDRDARSEYHHWLVERGQTPGEGNAFDRHAAARLPEDLSKPAFLGEQASRFIRRNASRPWMLTVNFFEPHMPFFGPRDGQYDPDEVPLPGNFDSPPGEDQPLKARAMSHAYCTDGFEGVDLSGERGWREIIARYWGLCSLVDTHFGRILAALDETGQLDDTLIVYTSDHGDMMGSHRLLAKCVQFEEAVRVPLLVKTPGQSRGLGMQSPVSQIDLVPTLLDYMGQACPPELQGQTLRPVLEREGRPETEVVIEWQGNNNGFGDRIGSVQLRDSMLEVADEGELVEAMRDPVRTVVTPSGWKFTWSTRGEHELYDLSSDPGETRNLAGCAKHRGIMSELSGRILRWQESTGDEVDLPDLSE